jgi:hypothetical protein
MVEDAGKKQRMYNKLALHQQNVQTLTHRRLLWFLNTCVYGLTRSAKAASWQWMSPLVIGRRPIFLPLSFAFSIPPVNPPVVNA